MIILTYALVFFSLFATACSDNNNETYVEPILSQIEVSKGLTSPLLGANNFAGAINLVTKKPTKELEGTISSGIFTGGGKKSYINLGSNQGKYYVQASGSYLERDNYPLSNDFTPTSLQSGDKRVQSDTLDKKINLKLNLFVHCAYKAEPYLQDCYENSDMQQCYSLPRLCLANWAGEVLG